MFTGRVFLMVGDNWRIRVRFTTTTMSNYKSAFIPNCTSRGDFEYRQYLTC